MVKHNQKKFPRSLALAYQHLREYSWYLCSRRSVRQLPDFQQLHSNPLVRTVFSFAAACFSKSKLT